MYTTFNNDWVKTVTKDEFVEHGLRCSNWTATDLEAYYNEVAPQAPAKPVKNDTKPNAPASNGVTKQPD